MSDGPVRASPDPSTGSGQVYKKAMDLTIHFEKVASNFSRYHKYTLGSELREKSREIVGLIIKAMILTIDGDEKKFNQGNIIFP